MMNRLAACSRRRRLIARLHSRAKRLRLAPSVTKLILVRPGMVLPRSRLISSSQTSARSWFTISRQWLSAFRASRFNRHPTKNQRPKFLVALPRRQRRRKLVLVRPPWLQKTFHSLLSGERRAQWRPTRPLLHQSRSTRPSSKIASSRHRRHQLRQR